MKTKQLPKLKVSKSAVLTVASALSVAAVNYGLLGSPLAILSVGMLIAHEFGHFFAGHFAGSKVHSPFFIPLGVLTIGATRIENPDLNPIRIAASGMVYGALAGLLGLLLSLGLPFEVATAGIIGLLAYEIGWGVLGGDGKKLRAALRGV